MPSQPLSQKATAHLRALCLGAPHRRVGSPGNRTSTDYVTQQLTSLGYQIECPSFDCWDWTHGAVQLHTAGTEFEAFASPYSLGCDVHAPLAVASTLSELESAHATGKILLLYGDLAQTQLTPKRYPFYSTEEHQRIFKLLEEQAPMAIIAATMRNPELVGALYPFPLIEDGDFDIPSVYTTAEQGQRLLQHHDRAVSLLLPAQRVPSHGCNVLARAGSNPTQRLVICAHIDTKETTPGALDNAAGVVTLLLLAELLQDYRDARQVELLFVNGEDDYSAAGELRYLSDNRDTMREIALAVNLDAVGYREGHSTYSLYECPADLATSIRTAFAAHPELLAGPPWYQSDHMIFVQHQRPALAITSERFVQLLAEVIHTDRDQPELVDPDKLVRIAQGLRGLCQGLAK